MTTDADAARLAEVLRPRLVEGGIADFGGLRRQLYLLPDWRG
jgi:hypothetical protein